MSKKKRIENELPDERLKSSEQTENTGHNIKKQPLGQNARRG